MTELDDLLRSGRLERVERDTARAAAKLEEAARHLRSAKAIATDDPAGAYVLLYDAARKAVDAHLAANGYRVSKSRLGGHEATALYARLVISGDHAVDAQALDRMRKHRIASSTGRGTSRRHGSKPTTPTPRGSSPASALSWDCNRARSGEETAGATRYTPYVRNGRERRLWVNPIKTRIVLLLAVATAASVFTASPAPASDSCHPMPEAYCNTIQYLNDCVFWPPPADYCDS